MKCKGFFWHVHHDRLVEWSDDISKRIAYIRSKKPENERELRLRLLKPVRGKLPAGLAKALTAYDKARAAYDKALAARDKALAARDKARAAYRKALAARDKALAAYDKALAARDKARAAYDKALAARDKEIEALHMKECPDCPWDGKTIFSEKEKEGKS
jgi:tetratricopeptide (TPR) repeat protein